MEAGPSWDFSAISATFQCSLCLEQQPQDDSVRIDDEQQVCHQCFAAHIKPKFALAIEHESHYPVRFGRTQLHPRDFPDFFTADEIATWQQREVEYTTPVASRLYCGQSSCQKFLGNLEEITEMEIACTCGYNTTRLAAAGELPDPLAGLERGRDYQQCPNPRCSVNIQLSAACNMLSCRCGTTFCYLCGLEVDPNSGHWREGGCPRWNHADDANAMFDRPDQVHQQPLPPQLPLPDRNPMPALLSQAMNALAVDRPQPETRPDEDPFRAGVPAPSPARFGPSRAEIMRRAMDHTAAQMGMGRQQNQRRRG